MAEKSDGEQNDVNHLKLISLLAQNSKTCLLILLSHQLKTLDVSFIKYISDHLEEIKTLEKEGIFTTNEIESLLSQKVNPEQFDLHLICLLLRFMTSTVNSETRISSDHLFDSLSVPDDAEYSISAELSRLSSFRNKILHQPNSRVDDDEFDHLFMDIQETLVRILRKAKCSRPEVKSIRKDMNSLKKSSIEVLGESILQNVLECVRWSGGEFDRFQRRLENLQIEMANNQVRKDGASRTDNTPRQIQNLNDLKRELQKLSGAGDTVMCQVTREGTREELEGIRQDIKELFAAMQKMSMHLLSKVPLEKLDSTGSSAGQNRDFSPCSSNSLNNALEGKRLWEIDETLGKNAIIPPVLYCNINHPELKMLFPNNFERYREFAKIWNKLTKDEKKLYLTKTNMNQAKGKDKTRKRRYTEITSCQGGKKSFDDPFFYFHVFVSHVIEFQRPSFIVNNYGTTNMCAGGAACIGGNQSAGPSFAGTSHSSYYPSHTPGAYTAIGRNISMWSPLMGSSLESSRNSGNMKKKYDDCLTPTMLDIYKQIMSSVGAIMYHGNCHGTGFRVGTKYIATTWHIVLPIIDPRRSGEKNMRNLTTAYIVFSDSPTDASFKKYFFTSVIHFSDEYLDIAILEVSNTDGLPSKLILRKEPLIPADAKTVSVIGYGHPKNPNKHVEFRCPVVHSDSKEIRAAQVYLMHHASKFKHGLLSGVNYSVVDSGYKDFDAPHKILLHIFMEHGASGSPILACVNPSAGIVEVVGVFTHAMPEFFFCLNDNFKHFMPDDFRFECGSRISHIYKQMIVPRSTCNLALDLFG